MLYDEIFEIYGVYIIIAGVLAFIVTGLLASVVYGGAFRFFEPPKKEKEVKINAKVIGKDKNRVVRFEIESGEQMSLKLKRQDYDYIFKGEEGTLTYKKDLMVKFERIEDRE